MTLFIVLGILIGISMSVYGALTVRQVEDTLTARLNRFNLKPASTLTQLELQIPRGERLLGPARRQLAGYVRRITPVGTVERIQTRLAQAGNPNNLTVQDFLGLKGLLAIGGGVAGFLILSVLLHTGIRKLVIFTAVMVVVGYFFPEFWLRNKIKQRREEIQKFMADAIDVLAISVEAGQGFDGALESLSRRKKNALTYEFDRFRVEVQAGKGRREALRDLALRADVEDLNGFVAAMIQADQLGIGIAHVLKTQADELRVKRRQRAEEKAHQAPVKMLFPLIFLMFPSLFIVILGPSVPRLMSIMH